LGTALLRRRSGESKELERIETEAHRLDSMINDLLGEGFTHLLGFKRRVVQHFAPQLIGFDRLAHQGVFLLRRRSGESKELERIETEAHRLDSMINDLLVMSRDTQR
jgi:signal transduction histidine kinase